MITGLINKRGVISAHISVRSTKRLRWKHFINKSMLFVVGLGLGDAKDITVKGLEAVRRADRVILEAYTSILTIGREALVNFRSNI
jgi:hypothetical protein